MQIKKRAKSVSFGKSVDSKPQAASKKPEKVAEVKKAKEVEEVKRVEKVQKPEESEPETDVLSPEAVKELLRAKDVSVESEKGEPEAGETSKDVPFSDMKDEDVAPEKEENEAEKSAVVEVVEKKSDALVEKKEEDADPVEPKADFAGSSVELKDERGSPSAFYGKDQAPRIAERTHRKRPRYLVHFLVVAFASFALGLASMYGVDYALKHKIDMAGFMPKPTPTAAPTPTKEPEVTVKEVDLSQYTIRILNGSGIKGEAAKLKAALVAAGFKTGILGNADRSDYVKTQVAAKESVSPEYLKKLEEELGKSYVLDKASKLPASSTEDVAVTIGSEAAK